MGVENVVEVIQICSYFMVSVEYEEIFVFEDLILAANVACLRCLVDDCLRNLEQE